jgi:hypothetical protein
MSWIKACKIYQTQRGEDAKYLVPKKGSDEYEIVKKIFDAMEKPPPKDKSYTQEKKEQKKEYQKTVKANKLAAEEVLEGTGDTPVVIPVIPVIKKTRVKKKPTQQDAETVAVA